MSHVLFHEVFVLGFADSVCIRHHRHDHTAECLTHWKPSKQHWFFSTNLVILGHVRVARSRRRHRAARSKRLFHCFIRALLGRFDRLLLPQTVVLLPTRLAAPSHATSAGPHCLSNLLRSPPRSKPMPKAESPHLFLQNNSATFALADATSSDLRSLPSR